MENPPDLWTGGFVLSRRGKLSVAQGNNFLKTMKRGNMFLFGQLYQAIGTEIVKTNAVQKLLEKAFRMFFCEKFPQHVIASE